MSKILNLFKYLIYRNGLHFNLILYKRWKWKKHIWKNVDTLEIGTGGGPWTVELLKRNNQITCVDIRKEDLKRVEDKLKDFNLPKNKIELINSHINKFNTNKKFDQIIIFETLEHIQDDKSTIKKLSKLLKKEGQILISTPNKDCPTVQNGKLSKIEDGGHVRDGYSFKDFEKLLGGVNLKIIFKNNCGGYFTQKAVVIQNKITNKFGNNIYLENFTNFILKPITWFDFLYPSYPKYVNFVIAKHK